MTIGPAFFGSHLPGILDGYTADIWAACGLQRLIANYPTAVVVENSSATDLTIPLNGAGNLDTTTLLAHAPTSGTAQALTDQATVHFCGNGTSSAQPVIVSGGSYLGLLQFDGTTDAYGFDGTFGGVSGITVFMRARLRSTSAVQVLLELSPLWVNEDALVVYYDNSISRFVVGSHRNTGSQLAVSEFNISATTEAVWCFRIDRTQTSGANQCVMFVNGTKQTRTGSTGETGTVPSGNFGSHTLFLGARNSTQFFSSLDLKSVVVYSTALSDGNVSAISALL